jgi:1-acyl-sn-glycerol-3-phosphate acyltransferase
VVERFNKADRMVLGVSPEGTRKKVDYWKTGFYYIALKAKVPIGFGYLDYKTKTAGCHPEPFYPTGDIEADFAAFRDFYKDMVGRVPSNFTNATLKPERTTEY